MLTCKDISPGDVLLCRADTTQNKGAPVRAVIKAATNSPYTHAAIALSDAKIFDARPMHGVTNRSLAELLGESRHVAVLRHPDA